jgi:hypothetical protein
VEGVTGGNSNPDTNSSAVEAADNRAIAVVPANLDVRQQVEVLLHFHGQNVGYRQRARRGRASDGPGMEVGTVRDVEVDRIEKQIQASARPMVGVLPQGSERPARGTNSNFGASGFNSDAYIGVVFDRLTAMRVWAARPTVRTVIVSGHSGGGGHIADMLSERGTPRLPSNMGELVLFDAINGPNELRTVTDWVRGRLRGDLHNLTIRPTEADRLAYLASSLRFRGYYTGGGYATRYRALNASIHAWFGANAGALSRLGPSVGTRLHDNYAIAQVSGSHNHIMGTDSSLLDAINALPPATAPAAPAPAAPAPAGGSGNR